MFKTIELLHTSYVDREAFNIPALQAFFFKQYPDSDKETYLELFKTIAETQIDEDLGVGLLNQIKQRSKALKLSEAAFKFSSGNSTLSAVQEAFKALDEAPSDIAIDDDGMNLDNILDGAILTPGLRWRLNCLNKSLGSLREGDFGFLFKRPESGGTAFCASEVGHMLSQSDRPFFWFNNEEADNKVKLRVYLSYFGITLDELINNKQKYQTLWQEQVGHRFKFYGLEYCNKKTIEDLIKKFNPRLVVYDQLDKVQGFDNDRDDLRLGSIYQWTRELCKLGHSGIGVTQADGSAEGVKWLTMQHIANAKTSKQAEGDWILGMGKTTQDGMENVRYLNICKNKLLGDKGSIPELRHGKFEVLIDASRMQFKDVQKW